MPLRTLSTNLTAAFSELTEQVRDAVLLVELPRNELHYANPAAIAMGRRAGAPDQDNAAAHLLTLTPPHAFCEALRAGSWQGLAASGDGSFNIELSLRVISTVSAPDIALAVLLARETGPTEALLQAAEDQNADLRRAYSQLALAQQSMLQNEKMASAGRLAAGVAHEINNPIGYVHANLGTLRNYVNDLLSLLAEYDGLLRAGSADRTVASELDRLRHRYDIDYIVRDLPQVVSESLEGIERVRKIVQDLKDFSHPSRQEAWSKVDLHKVLNSTLNIASSEIKYKARVEKQLGELPPVECVPSEISQVLMNILVNAAQAIQDQGQISIATGCLNDEVWISISDNGPGISNSILPQIFEPFFTTKPIGAGTGLGLWISYRIINRHNGRIEVFSSAGQGTTFRIVLPVHQPA